MLARRRAVLKAHGWAFVLSTATSPADLPVLGDAVVGGAPLGCATVYELRE